MQHRIVALTGQEARKAFFNEAALDFNEGYKILMGGAPRLENIDEQIESSSTNAELLRRLLLIMHKAAIAESESYNYTLCFISQCLFRHSDYFRLEHPLLTEDLNRRMLSWGREGQINPFKEVYEVCHCKDGTSLHADAN